MLTGLYNFLPGLRPQVNRTSSLTASTKPRLYANASHAPVSLADIGDPHGDLLQLLCKLVQVAGEAFINPCHPGGELYQLLGEQLIADGALPFWMLFEGFEQVLSAVYLSHSFDSRPPGGPRIDGKRRRLHDLLEPSLLAANTSGPRSYEPLKVSGCRSGWIEESAPLDW